MIKRFFFLITLTTVSLPLFCKEPTLISRLAEMNLKSFGWDQEKWNAHTMRGYLETYMKYRMNPSKKMLRNKAFSFYDAVEKKSPLTSNILLDTSSTWEDLTLFCGQEDKGIYVADKLCRAQTELGTLAQYVRLATPINDVERLTARQKIIRTIVSHSEVQKQLDDIFVSQKTPEIIFLGFFDNDSLLHTVHNQCEIQPNMCKPLNKVPLLLLLNSWYNHGLRIGWAYGTAIGAAACGIYGLKKISGTHISDDSWIHTYTDQSIGGPANIIRWFWNYDSRLGRSGIALSLALFLALNVEPTLGWMEDCFFVEECVHRITNQLALFMNNARRAYETVRQFPDLAQFDEFQGLISFFEIDLKNSQELQDFCDLLASDTFKHEPSVFAHTGRIIRAFTFMHEIKEQLIPLALGMGALDCYLGYAKLFSEFEEKRVHFCFPSYVTAQKPEIGLTEFWHPLIDAEKVVTNNVSLGKGNRQNMVITGPNAGGKSTILRSITLCILMAQTIGIAPALSLSFTPFRSIKTYLNIVDDIGAGNSLFMAEAKQAQRIIDVVETSSQDSFTFAAFDEVFNGTSPVEGSAAAYSVASHLGNYDKCICIIATHFPILTKLEAATHSFKNYKVSVDQHKRALGYPYLLEEGKSHQRVALDVLREQGFSGSLLDEANKLVHDPTILQN